MTTSRFTRKERRYARHREEILAAALALFADKGFHNVTMQEIAQAAEFSVGKLYTFFTTKDHLYQALIQEKAETLYADILAELSSEENERTVIARANALKVQRFLENADIIRLILSETIAAGYSLRAGLTRDIRAQYDALLHMAGRLFAKGIRNGRFVPGDPHLYAVALDGMTNAMVAALIEHPDKQRCEIDALCRRFLNSISTHPVADDA
jgi:AcrR family transcriptional regulator